MLRTIAMTVLLASVTMPARHARADTGPATSPLFNVRLDGDTTSESVIPQIVEAGHDQLVAACYDNPGVSIRVFNPLASGAYRDVPCSVILDDGEAAGQAAPLTSGGAERLGQAQQKWSPFGLGCGIFVGAAGAFMNHALCNRPGAEQPEACRNLAEIGFFGLGIMCAFI